MKISKFVWEDDAFFKVMHTPQLIAFTKLLRPNQALRMVRRNVFGQYPRVPLFVDQVLDHGDYANLRLCLADVVQGKDVHVLTSGFSLVSSGLRWAHSRSPVKVIEISSSETKLDSSQLM